jgi:hypothetical protein
MHVASSPGTAGGAALGTETVLRDPDGNEIVLQQV